MITPRRFHVFLFALMAILLGAIPLAARQQQQQQTPDASAAPVPPAIFSARKVFLSNTGADSGLFPHPFSGAQDRAYNQFYAAMQKWGRYELVGDPEEADLVFELRLTSPNGPANPDKQKGASDPVPIFRLEIVDRKSHYTLWAVTESVNIAYFQKTHDRNFDDALNALLVDVQNLPKTKPSSTSASK